MNTNSLESEFRQIGAVRRSQEIVDQIVQAINAGKFAPGDKLPSQRVLIKQFNTSLRTLQEALEALQIQGLIEIKVGSKGGSFVKNVKPMEVGPSLEYLIRNWETSLEDILDFRAGLEGLATSAAIKKVQPENLNRLKQSIEAGREKKIRGEFDLRSFLEWDFDLHLALTKASANELYYANIKLVLKKTLALLDTYLVPPSMAYQFNISECLEDWTNIHQSLEQGQADRLKSLVQSHIRKSSRILFDIRDARNAEHQNASPLPIGLHLTAATSESNQEAILMFAGVDPLDRNRSALEPVYVSKWRLPALGWWTGEWGALGLEAKFAINAAVNEINRSGGIRGIPIELTWYDTGYDKQKTISVMKEALAQKPLVLIGPLTDVTLSAACPMAYHEQVFILSGPGDNVPFIDSYPWGTALLSPIEGITKVAAEYWHSLHGSDVKSIVFFTNPVAISIRRQAAVFRQMFEQMGILVHPDINIPTDTSDFCPFVQKALDFGAGAFINLNLPRQAANICMELFKKGISDGWRIINFPAADQALLYEIGNGYLEGTYVYNLYNVDYQDDNWMKLLMRYRKWKKDTSARPTMMVPFTYDIPFIIKNAFERMNITGEPDRLPVERKLVKDHILDLKNFAGVQGSITVVKGTGGAIKPVFFYKIQNYKPHLIATLEPEMILP